MFFVLDVLIVLVFYAIALFSQGENLYLQTGNTGRGICILYIAQPTGFSS